MSTHWLRPVQPATADTRMRLLCLPFAGGSASAYRSWARLAPSWLQIVAVQLPGRGDRFQESLLHDMDALVEALDDELAASPDLPFAIYGHSMGALVGLALARRIEALPGRRAPVAFFPAAAPPPGIRRDVDVSGRSDAFLADWLRRMGGTPTEVLQDADLMSLVLPILRADLSVLESMRGRTGAPIECPVHALAGDNDASITVESMRHWQAVTEADFELTVVSGGHMFVAEAALEVLPMIVVTLDAVDCRLVVSAT